MERNSELRMPSNIEAERSVLGSMLLSPEICADVIGELSSDDFYVSSHKEIFTAISDIFSNGVGVDLISVVDRLKNQDKLDMIGGPAYLAEISTVIPTTSSATGHCNIILESAIKRKMLIASTELKSQCLNGVSSQDIIENFGKKFFDITARKKSENANIKTVVQQVYSNTQKLADNNGVIGIPTGFYSLDRILAGFIKKDLIIVAARPSMGKTALAMSFANNASKNGFKTLVFSLEMGKESLVQRELAKESGISGDALRRGIIREEQWPTLEHSVNRIKKLDIIIDDTPGLSITELRARAKRQALKTGIDLIVVDYLQLMRSKAENRNMEISYISAGLKGIAKELDIPVIALSQLNRSLEQRSNKRPKLSDLRESGAIEQDADVIIFIYRDEVYNTSDDNPLRGTAELIVGKQRCGPIGTIKMGFDGPRTKFFELD